MSGALAQQQAAEDRQSAQPAQPEHLFNNMIDTTLVSFCSEPKNQLTTILVLLDFVWTS